MIVALQRVPFCVNSNRVSENQEPVKGGHVSPLQQMRNTLTPVNGLSGCSAKGLLRFVSGDTSIVLRAHRLYFRMASLGIPAVAEATYRTFWLPRIFFIWHRWLRSQGVAKQVLTESHR